MNLRLGVATCFIPSSLCLHISLLQNDFGIFWEILESHPFQYKKPEFE